MLKIHFMYAMYVFFVLEEMGHLAYVFMMFIKGMTLAYGKH